MYNTNLDTKTLLVTIIQLNTAIRKQRKTKK